MNTASIAESYSRHKNLKLVGLEIGMPWQSVYVALKKAGVPVIGDKSRYGSDKDKLAVRAEQDFARLVPFATNNNQTKYQSKVDFVINGDGIDVKAARLAQGCKRFPAKRWAFSVKKQECVAAYIVCFGYRDDRTYRVFLIPSEFIRHYQSITVSEHGKSKWLAFEVSPNELSDFFVMMYGSTAAKHKERTP